MINGNEKRFRDERKEDRILVGSLHLRYDIHAPYLDATTQKEEEDEEIGRREGRLVRSGLVR